MFVEGNTIQEASPFWGDINHCYSIICRSYGAWIAFSNGSTHITLLTELNQKSFFYLFSFILLCGLRQAAKPLNERK